MCKWGSECRITTFPDSRYLPCYIIQTLLGEASCGAGAQSVTVKPTGCGFDPHSRTISGIYLNLYFNFFAMVSRQKRGIEFCHSTRNSNSAESGERLKKCLNTRLPLPTAVCGIQREADY